MKPHPIRSALLLLLCAAALPGAAFSYPISPVPLWDLIERADLVVLARVSRVELNPRSADEKIASGDYYDRDVAVLDVLETWKGERVAQVRVTFGSGWICPAPPRFLESRIVLAFLERGEAQVKRLEEERSRRLEAKATGEAAEAAASGDAAEDEASSESPEAQAARQAEEAQSARRFAEWSKGRWMAVALSYGTLYPDASEVPVFRALIVEAVGLQRAGAVSERPRRDWLVRAASRRATRWHGLYELAPRTDALHFFYDRADREAEPSDLSTREFAALAVGFVKEPSVDGTLPMMLSLLAGHGGREVDRAAASAIEAVIRQQPLPWWIGDAMARVLERFGDPDPERRLGLDDPHCDGLVTCSRIDRAALPGIWSDARRELGIPEVAPVKAPARTRGVGGETPD